MKANTKSVFVGAFACVSMLILGTAADAQSFKHVHALANKLEKQLNVLHREADAHFRPFPKHVHLHNDIEKMQKLAHHIHDLVDEKGSLRHALADVKMLDSHFHHVRGLVKDMNQSGKLGPKATRHINQTLREISNTLHHLREDLEDLDHEFHHHH